MTRILYEKEKHMKIPKYVILEEVKRVCRELKISDWTQKKEPKVSLKTDVNGRVLTDGSRGLSDGLYAAGECA
jgi:hypothetical protein